MDKASVSEAEDCGFESRRGYQECVNEHFDEHYWYGVRMQTSSL